MVLLEKFDGSHWTEFPVELTRKQYHLAKLPSYLVLLVTRFKKNRFFVEKNPTIVTFPVKNLDLAPYVKGATQVHCLSLFLSIVSVFDFVFSRSNIIWCRAFVIKERPALESNHVFLSLPVVFFFVLCLDM